MPIDDKSMQPFYKALIESTRDIVMLIDANGVLQFVSPSITAIFDHEVDELLGTIVFDHVHPEDQDRAIEVLHEIIEGQDVPPFIVRYQHKNGSWRFLEVIAHYLGEDISDVMITSRDVTEFEEDTKARRLVDLSFEAAFNASSAMNSISIAETGELLTVNEGWLDSLGWTREEAVGKTAIDLKIWAHTEDRDKAISEMERNRFLHGYRVELRTKTGEICVVRLDATYLYLPVGKRLYFSAIDITEQEKTEEKLRQSQRLDAIGHLTGGIAHDFNNLLSVIMGHSELAKSLVSESGQVSDSLDAIFRASVTGANLIQQLLSFSRNQRLSPTTLQLVHHLEAMRPLLQTSLAKDIELKITSTGSNWLCLIDPLQLDNAILNIAINARDAMPKGGRLEVIVDEKVLTEAEAAEHDVKAGEYVQLRLQDTGVGMTESARKQAFDPFFTTKQDSGGSGLGLSMVFGFISQSGGSVHIESTEAGTSIVLLLPRASSEVDLEDDAEVDDVNFLQGKRVLLVEDNSDVRFFVASLLELLGFEVSMAASSEEAQGFEKMNFDLLVCDLMLPGERKGPQIAARFQQTHSDLPVLFMSGYQEGILKPQDLESANVSFIQKPFNKSDFTVKIVNLLTQA